jgi:hypothetical protein
MGDIALTVAVLISMGMTIRLWQLSRRGPKPRFLRALLEGSPITPKHERASGLPQEGWGATGEDKSFFADFSIFADKLNRWFDPEPWRVQELPKLELSGAAALSEATTYGRRYKIFYNDFEVGLLQIQPLPARWGPGRNIRTNIELEFARFLPFHAIMILTGFVAALTAVGSREEGQNATFATWAAMLNRLWQIEFDRDLDDRNNGGSIEIQFEGSANEIFAKSK